MSIGIYDEYRHIVEVKFIIQRGAEAFLDINVSNQIMSR